MPENGKGYDYLVIGSDAVSIGVIKELTKLGKSVLVIDPQKDIVDFLAHEGYNAILREPEKLESYKDLELQKFSAILILSPSDETNIKVAKKIKEFTQETPIIAKVTTPKAKEDLESLGVEVVVLSTDAVKSAIIEETKKLETYQKLGKLKKILAEMKGKKLGIFTHDNPDPDSISSAYTLKEIAKNFGVDADILYYGEILHHKNRAMVNLLEIPMINAKDADLSKYSKFAIVDSSGPGKNNSIPQNIEISIVIDHHPADDARAEYVDIRTNVGATATILVEYIKILKIVPTKTLATALLFGIKVETDDFKRNAKISDFLAAAYLYPLVDHELIEKMERPAMSVEALEVLGAAIKNRQIYPSFLISFAGFTNDRDALPQAADFLLKLEGVSTVVVYGIVKDMVYVSARNKDVRINIGEVLKKAFQDVGSAGGHAHAAGAQIPLGIFGEVTDKDTLAKLISDAVKRRFLSAVGIESLKL